MAEHRFQSVVFCGKQVDLGPRPDGAFKNACTMYDEAGRSLATYETARANILADPDLSKTGKEKALARAKEEFDQIHQRWTRTNMADRKQEIEDRLSELHSLDRREKDDMAGQLSDREDREYFMSLKGDEKTDLIGAMTRGEEPGITAAVLRKSDRQMGLRLDLRAELMEKGGIVGKRDAPEVGRLIAEQTAMAKGEAALEKAKDKIFERSELDGVPATQQARDALEVDGSQKVEGEHKVEPFVAPKAAPFETDKDGVIDLKISKKEDAA